MNANWNAPSSPSSPAASGGVVNEGLEEFLEAYDSHRVADQAKWYGQRSHEYGRSARQLSWANEGSLLVAAACGLIAAVWTEQAVWLGVAAAGFAALGVALTAWGDVVGFTANAELYDAARVSLAALRPDRPSAEAQPEEVRAYVDDVENILLGEVRTWGEKWAPMTERDGPT